MIAPISSADDCWKLLRGRVVDAIWRFDLHATTKPPSVHRQQLSFGRKKRRPKASE